MRRSISFFWTILYVPILFAQIATRHLTVVDGLHNNQVRQIVELPNGQMLVETEGIFSLYNGKNFVTLSCNLDSVFSLPSFGCHDHLWQGDSLLWLKDFYSLYLFNARTRRFIYDYERYAANAKLRSFIEENGDSVTHARLRAIESLQPLLDSLTAGTSIQGEPLQAYQCDRQGGQWFGTLNGGIVYLPPSTHAWRRISLTTDDFIRRMIGIDRHTMLLAGERGIYLFDCDEERITRTLATGSIHCAEISRDSRGRVWLATKQGLYSYDHGVLENYNLSNTKGFVHDHMRFALPLDESRLLVCNYMHELGFFYPEERRMEMLNPSIPSLSDYRTMIVAATLQNRNQVAVCTQNGCFVLNVARMQKEEMPGLRPVSGYSHKFNCLLLDRNAVLWLGTQNGLLRLSGDAVRRLTRDDGLSNECIQSLAEDGLGNIWVGTSNGVNRISTDPNTHELYIRNIGTDYGLPAVEMTERGICLMPDGTLYMATPAGLVSLLTSDFQAKASKMPTVLVGIQVAGEDMTLDTLPLTLNYRQNYIDLQVSALNYAHPNQVRYRYRVVETGGEWHSTTGNDGRMATIRLSDLDPGTYTIEIQSSMGDHVWGEVLRKTFIITPPLFQTWWAKVIYLLLACAIILLLLRWYLNNRKAKLRRENDQRVNELFELREEARHQFAQSVEVDSERITTNPEEQQLIERIMKAIGHNMSNTDYTVDLLARDIGMSRANLYKKMQTMLGITPNDFMRNVRLKRAAELLAKSDVPVNQLALMVGFQTPRYFSQCFRKMFGVTPTEYREGRDQE